MNWHQLKQGLQINSSFHTSQNCWLLFGHPIGPWSSTPTLVLFFSRTIQPHLSGSLNPVGFGFSSPFPGYVDYLPYRTIPKSVDFRQDLEPCTGNTHPILLSMRFLGIMASIALREFASFSSDICFGIPRIYSNPLFGIWSKKKEYLPWVTNMH